MYIYIHICIYMYIYIIIIYICIPVYPHDIPRSLSQMSPWPHLHAALAQDGVIPHGLEGFLGVVATLGSALARLSGAWRICCWCLECYTHTYIYINYIYIIYIYICLRTFLLILHDCIIKIHQGLKLLHRVEYGSTCPSG